jgi:hypothetical protein
MSLTIANRPHSTKPGPELSGEVFATLINLSGRRRFTSQRVVLYAVLAGAKDPSAITAVQNSLNLETSPLY